MNLLGSQKQKKTTNSAYGIPGGLKWFSLALTVCIFAGNQLRKINIDHSDPTQPFTTDFARNHMNPKSCGTCMACLDLFNTCFNNSVQPTRANTKPDVSERQIGMRGVQRSKMIPKLLKRNNGLQCS